MNGIKKCRPMSGADLVARSNQEIKARARATIAVAPGPARLGSVSSACPLISTCVCPSVCLFVCELAVKVGERRVFLHSAVAVAAAAGESI